MVTNTAVTCLMSHRRHPSVTSNVLAAILTTKMADRSLAVHVTGNQQKRRVRMRRVIDFYFR